MPDRRTFLKLSTFGAAGLLTSSKFSLPLFAGRASLLDPNAIPKYVMPLVVPLAMPRTRKIVQRGQLIDYYEIAVRQFRQQVLPAGMPATTVWSYGSVNHPGTFNYPSFTIEAKSNRPVRVKWINGLVDRNNNFLPHLLAVDPTLHWANPPGPIDSAPSFSSTPKRYRGPVPIVTHVHGAHSTEESDGFAEAWYLPAAKNIPPGYSREGSLYSTFKAKFQSKWGQEWKPGTAVFQYANDQPAATIWYHDHTLGMTRLNVHAGPAGFFLIRGGQFDLPSGILPGPAANDDSSPFDRFFEIPLAIQDRSFKPDGSLFYPDGRKFFDEFAGPYIPESDISPIFNPEVFGSTMLVNGRTWPFLQVEPRRYRFRLLNGCNARFVLLKLVSNPLAERPAPSVLPFWQIGSEGGFLPRPVQLSQLLMGLAERVDVIVDFTGLRVGTEIFLINEAPDEPFGGGLPGTDFPVADPATTGQVMKFVVVPLTAPDTSHNPFELDLPRIPPLGRAVRRRRLSLNEEDSAVLAGVGPRAAMLGTLDNGGNPVHLGWGADITENPGLGDTEIWEFFNFTADAHPIHIHQVQFQVVNRQGLVTDGEIAIAPAQFSGPPRAREPWETGFKDSVIVYPGQVTRVKAKFDLPGLFVWHCHIVEHEDNEMMRPLRIGR